MYYARCRCGHRPTAHPRQAATKFVRSWVVGPSSRVPSPANREPCNRHSHDWSASLQFTIPPRMRADPRHDVLDTLDGAPGSQMPGGPPTTPQPSQVRSEDAVTGVIQLLDEG
jgi:hypothetical protein